MTPEMVAFKARLDAWRAMPEDQQRAWFAAHQPADMKGLLARVAACPDRGGVLPVSQQPQHCAKCGELSLCNLKKGKIPGKVSLRECIECRRATPPT